MRIIIYTAIFGSYDNLHDVSKYLDKNITFRCYTNCIQPNSAGIPSRYKGWQIINVIGNPFTGYDANAKANRAYKINQLIAVPDSDINLYIDGNKTIINIDMILNYCNKLWENQDIDAFFCKHTERDTVEQEAREVIRLRRDKEDTVTSQINGYKQEGFPDNIPLIVASVQFRKTHSKPLNDMLDIWWNEVKNKSYRDQLSLPFSIWKSGFNRYKLLDVPTERFKMITNAFHRKALLV